MTELLPCPFCGGKAHTLSQAPKGVDYAVGCSDDDCLGFVGLGWIYNTEAEAIAAWNTRHYYGLTDEDYNILLDELGVSERTCKMDGDTEYIECKVQTFTCSTCGWHGAIDDLFASDTQPNYCPNCGARRVGE